MSWIPGLLRFARNDDDKDAILSSPKRL